MPAVQVSGRCQPGGCRTIVLLLVHAKVAAAVLHQGARLPEAAGVKQHLRLFDGRAGQAMRASWIVGRCLLGASSS